MRLASRPCVRSIKATRDIKGFNVLKTMSHQQRKPKVQAAASPMASYVCIDCGYVYEPITEEEAFANLPDDWVCPACAADKTRFEEVDPVATGGAEPAVAAEPRTSAAGPVTLDPSKPVTLKLAEKEPISPDTRRFRFALPTDNHVLGLPVGQHVRFSFTNPAGEVVTRPYTPTSSDREIGYVDFVIKVYFAGVNPKFPDGGRMSQHLESLKVGDNMTLQGPVGRITYKGGGVFCVKEPAAGTDTARPAATALGMIAGGTGITPIMQVAREILARKEDIQIRMLVANKTEADILMRQDLDRMQTEFPQVKVYYTLDQPPAGWRQGSGFITEEMLKAQLPAASPSTQILMCGPPPMINMACLPNLEKLGFKEENILPF